MRPRQPDLRLIKIHRNYTVEEIATLLDVHRHTVRSWIKAGLQVIDARRPVLILGSQLQSFHRKRRDQNKRPCAPGEIYCMRCREPRKPLDQQATFHPLTATNGDLIGRCPACDCRMFRRVNLSKLDLVKGDLVITSTEGQEHISESSSLSANRDFRKDSADHGNPQP